MPRYEFECEACKKRFERIQKFSDPNPETCPSCGKGPVRKLPSSPAIQFKGSGFYITDYAKKTTSEAGAGSKSAGSEKSGDSKGDSKSDSKSDSKGDSKSSTDSGSTTSSSSSNSTDSGSTSSDKKS